MEKNKINLVIEAKHKENIIFKRKIMYIAIIALCVIAILVGSYIQVFKNEDVEYVELSDAQYSDLESQFTEIFKNNINNNSNYNLSKIKKIKNNDDIVDNVYVNMDKEENKYNLNVSIPYINIDSDAIEKCNSEIQSIFKQKALDIIEANRNINSIYTVEYTAYINSNILSLVIRSTLKEEENPQRVIIQTYNYDLKKGKIATIDKLLDIKGISKNYAESKVREKIKEEQEKIQQLEQFGYAIFNRDYKSDIYKMQNTTEFFFGEQGCIYLIYAYGNNNYTSEMDLLIL